MSSRPEELTERLGAASVETGGEALLKVLREVKNQIIGNKTKKVLYLHLGAVPRIVAVLTSALDADWGSTATSLIVQSAAALGSFSCGVDDGVRAVLDAGAVPHLIRLLSSHEEKVSTFFPLHLIRWGLVFYVIGVFPLGGWWLIPLPLSSM